MKSLRVSFALAGIFMLSASALSAQASSVSCGDGTKPKIGHFSCWGHGGLVTVGAKSAAKADAKTASKATKKDKGSKAKKKVRKHPRSTVAKPHKNDRKKARAKRS